MSPIFRGKQFLAARVALLLDGSEVEATVDDGRRFLLSFPSDRSWECLYLLRTFETTTTAILRSIIQPRDTVFDIGANLGWYTTLFGGLVSSGHVHAFEPLPATFEKLRVNCELNKLRENLTVNNLALTDGVGKREMFLFDGLGHGHASMSTLGREDTRAVAVDVSTLDRYIERHSVSHIDLVKVDVEGAEMSMLGGAHNLLKMTPPAMWLFEMNNETAAAFGYRPPDILKYLCSYFDFSFFRIDNAVATISLMSSLDDYNDGDNVLCLELHYHSCILERLRSCDSVDLQE